MLFLFLACLTECTTQTATLRIGAAFCVEEERVCCNEEVCEHTFAIACFPDKLFVGNFESILPPQRDEKP